MFHIWSTFLLRINLARWKSKYRREVKRIRLLTKSFENWITFSTESMIKSKYRLAVQFYSRNSCRRAFCMWKIIKTTLSEQNDDLKGQINNYSDQKGNLDTHTMPSRQEDELKSDTMGNEKRDMIKKKILREHSSERHRSPNKFKPTFDWMYPNSRDIERDKLPQKEKKKEKKSIYSKSIKSNSTAFTKSSKYNLNQTDSSPCQLELGRKRNHNPSSRVIMNELISPLSLSFNKPVEQSPIPTWILSELDERIKGTKYDNSKRSFLNKRSFPPKKKLIGTFNLACPISDSVRQFHPHPKQDLSSDEMITSDSIGSDSIYRNQPIPHNFIHASNIRESTLFLRNTLFDKCNEIPQDDNASNISCRHDNKPIVKESDQPIRELVQQSLELLVNQVTDIVEEMNLAVIIEMQKESRFRNETREAVYCLVHAVEYCIHVRSQVRDCLESIVNFAVFMIQSKSQQMSLSQQTITQDTSVLNNICNKSPNDHAPSTKTHCKISLQCAKDAASDEDHVKKHGICENENENHVISCTNHHIKETLTKHYFEKSTKSITPKNNNHVNQIEMHCSNDIENLNKDEDNFTHYEWDQNITSENIDGVLQSLQKFKSEKAENKEK